jgi:hypothetical protein
MLEDSWNKHEETLCVGLNWERFKDVDHAKVTTILYILQAKFHYQTLQSNFRLSYIWCIGKSKQNSCIREIWIIKFSLPHKLWTKSKSKKSLFIVDMVKTGNISDQYYWIDINNMMIFLIGLFVS